MWLFFLFWIVVTADAEPLYRKIGDKAVLTPASVVNPIKSIVWKHGPNIAVVWHGFGDETLSYGHFKDRGLLNISNGALMIKGLTPDDSGNYTVEINDKLTSKSELLVISPVSKPTLSLCCELEMTYCVLTCNGDTTGAEPVTYNWTSGDMTWSSTKEQKITKENKELWSNWFSCAFENPVSNISSEKVFNPFKERDLTWVYSFIPVFLFILVECIIYLIYKCIKETNDQRKPCWYYNGDGCRKGKSCPYRHVCEFALKGNCPNGSNCKLKHPWKIFLFWKQHGICRDSQAAPALLSLHPGTKPQWQYRKEWHEFRHTRSTTECSVNSDEIEREYQQNPNSKMLFTVNRNYYELDFEAKIQINLKTKTRRRVRRVLL